MLGAAVGAELTTLGAAGLAVAGAATKDVMRSTPTSRRNGMEAQTDQAQRHHSGQQPEGSAPVLAGSPVPISIFDRQVSDRRWARL